MLRTICISAIEMLFVIIIIIIIIIIFKHLFCKQELITRARLRVQDFATGENFSFN